MSKIAGDDEWNEPKAIKILTLEHRMAARRMGFMDAFAPLYDVDSWRTGLLEGTLPALRFFSDQIFHLVNARRNDDKFAVTRIAKSYSPILTQIALREAKDAREHLQKVSAAIDNLMALWRDSSDPSLQQILRCIAEHKLFEIPDLLRPHAQGDIEKASSGAPDELEQEDRQTERDLAIEAFLATPFSQLEPMIEYLSGRAHFDTHQGVKGLEFDRVMVIMDDNEARGFSFKYEDLFGGKGPGDKTVENTRRLFYVTASRAKKSLALVAYSASPERIQNFVLHEGWFDSSEVVLGVPS